MEKFFQSTKAKIIMAGVAIALIVLLLIALIRHGGFETEPKGQTPEEIAEEARNQYDDDYADELDEESATEDDGEQVFFMPKEDVYSFSMTDAHGILLTFDRQDDQWIYTGDKSLDVNEERIDKILNYLCDVRFEKVYDDKNGSKYNLDQSADMYIIADSSGNSTIISLGESQEKGVYFAINYDFSKIYLNSGKLSKVREYTLEELLAL